MNDKGVTTGEVQAHLAEIYGVQVSRDHDQHDHRPGTRQPRRMAVPSAGRGAGRGCRRGLPPPSVVGGHTWTGRARTGRICSTRKNLLNKSVRDELAFRTRSVPPLEVGVDPVSYTALSPLSFLERSARVWPDKTAVVYGARRLTYREPAAEAQRVARALRASGAGRATGSLRRWHTSSVTRARRSSRDPGAAGAASRRQSRYRG
jgi:hypothetical protein